MSLGASWAGDTADAPPEQLAAIIDTTPAWKPIIAALRALRPGGRVVVNAIRKETRDQSELLSLDYGRDLWMEREIKSVANVTRADVRETLDAAASGEHPRHRGRASARSGERGARGAARSGGMGVAYSRVSRLSLTTRILTDGRGDGGTSLDCRSGVDAVRAASKSKRSSVSTVSVAPSVIY